MRKISGELVRWVISSDYDKIPEKVVNITKLQVLGLFGSVFASLKVNEGKKFLEAALNFSSGGDFPVPGSNKKVSFGDALYIYSTLSMVLDYDDYLFMGHTGHSAVWVSLLTSILNNRSSKDFINGVIIGNEAGGRVGGSVLLGNQNGQMWSYLHGINSVLIYGKLSDMSFETILGGLGNYLYQPHFPLYPGFMGAESKIFTASEPISSGLKALKYSSAGIGGFDEIMEHENGFLNNLSYYPFDFMFTGFGTSWLTKTLAVKKYPGCAYIDTTIDSLLKIIKDAEDEKLEIVADNIEEIVVNANLLTVEMDNMAQDYFKPNNLSPININFNLRLNIAVAIIAKALKPEYLTKSFLAEHKTDIFKIASKVKINHDIAKSFDLLYTVSQSMDWEKLIESIDKIKLKEAIELLQKQRVSSNIDINLKTLFSLRSQVRGDKRKFLQKMLLNRITNIISKNKEQTFSLNDIDFDKFQMPFGVDLSLTLKTGENFNNRVNIPDGVSYDDNFKEIVVNKFMSESKQFISEKKAVKFVEMVENMENYSPIELLSVLF